MVDGISVSSELVTGILQTMFGQGYLNSITIGILTLLTGYIFLTFRFVIIGKDNPIWKRIKQIDKLVISFFMGFAFILVGAETLFIVVMILKAVNGIQAFNSLGFTSDHVVFL
jgi:NhaP-type Na+/H+ or K+/H+ antiporter